MSAKEKFMNKMSENGWNAKRLIEGLWTLEKKINYGRNYLKYSSSFCIIRSEGSFMRKRIKTENLLWIIFTIIGGIFVVIGLIIVGNVF